MAENAPIRNKGRMKTRPWWCRLDDRKKHLDCKEFGSRNSQISHTFKNRCNPE